MGERGGRKGLIEVIEMGTERPEQVQTLVTALRGIGWQGEGLELGEAGAAEELGAADRPCRDRPEALRRGRGSMSAVVGLPSWQSNVHVLECWGLPSLSVNCPVYRSWDW
jgi:hypothetical protein